MKRGSVLPLRLRMGQPHRHAANDSESSHTYFLMTLFSYAYLLPDSAETLSSGKHIYQPYCAGCHATAVNAPRRDARAHWNKREMGSLLKMKGILIDAIGETSSF